MLLELDDTAARAELQRLFLRRIRLTAIDARLQAEMREEPEITFPPDVVNALASSPEVKEIVDSQQMAFTARRNNLNSDIKSIQESINALEERIQGSRVQLNAVQRQIVLLDEEIETKDRLVQAGLVRKPELMVLQRTKANLEGEIGRIMGDIGDAKERIARAVEQINGVRKTAIKTAVDQIHEIRGELADVRERMLSAKGVLDRVRITAPVSGVVVKLRYHTQWRCRGSWQEHHGAPAAQGRTDHRGAVAAAGYRQRQARPEGDGKAYRAEPADHADGFRRRDLSFGRHAGGREEVAAGGPNRHLYCSRQTRREDTITIPDFKATPGMPAEVYIQTAERTFFQYLVRPIHDSMVRAFRER